MPMRWIVKQEDPLATCDAQPPGAGRGPVVRLYLWPNRTLSPKGFVLVIAVSCALYTLPLMALLGTTLLWVLLPFPALALGGLWHALRRNTRDGRMMEDLCIWTDHMSLVRHDPGGSQRSWEGNPHWVRLDLIERGGPVENYITLTGSGRCVELGAFLSAAERKALFNELQVALVGLRGGVRLPERPPPRAPNAPAAGECVARTHPYHRTAP